MYMFKAKPNRIHIGGSSTKVFALAVFLVMAVFLAACGSASGQTLQVTGAWARPGLVDGNSAVYFTIDNPTAIEDTLLSASSDVAGSVELHMTMMEGDNMQMMPQKEVPVPVGKTEFKPGGLHVMLVGLKQDLKPGDTFSAMLKFKTAGEKSLEVTVAEP
jgi:copper(I)-binding protein